MVNRIRVTGKVPGVLFDKVLLPKRPYAT
jgi:hypothetical protein